MSFQLRGAHQKSLGERKGGRIGYDWCWDEVKVPKGRPCHRKESPRPKNRTLGELIELESGSNQWGRTTKGGVRLLRELS